MIRLLGALLMVAGGLALGAGQAWGLRQREQLLRQLAEDLAAIRRELAWCSISTPQLLEQLEEKGVSELSPLYHRCRLEIEREGATFSQSWIQALEELSLPLKTEERLLIRRLGEILGRYDREEQCEALTGMEEELRRRAEAQGAEYRRLGRMYLVLGGGAGALAVILLL